MGSLNWILNSENLEWWIRASFYVIVVIMAAMAGHDNRIEFEEEAPDLRVPEGLVAEVVVLED